MSRSTKDGRIVEHDAEPEQAPLQKRLAWSGCGFLLFVLFPGLLTLLLPTTLVTLSRSKQGVTARAYSLTLLVIPFKRAVVEDLQGVDERVEEGESTRQQQSDGSTRTVRAADHGFLVLEGARSMVTVRVSPVSLGRARARVEAFLQDSDERAVFYTVSHWMSMLLTVPFSLIGLAWIAGAPIAVVRWLIEGIRQRSDPR